jgi:hypothetical protein
VGSFIALSAFMMTEKCEKLQEPLRMQCSPDVMSCMVRKHGGEVSIIIKMK